jgi:murein L,D-transpeptidase YafK
MLKARYLFGPSCIEPDTLPLLKYYISSFDPTFLTPRPELTQLPPFAMEFKLYPKQIGAKTPTSYSIDHSAGRPIFGAQGRVRPFSCDKAEAGVLKGRFSDSAKSRLIGRPMQLGTVFKHVIAVMIFTVIAVSAYAQPGSKPNVAKPASSDGIAEARLIEIYRLIGAASTREAFSKAEELVKAYPNFQLAQLVYGDLLSALSRPIRQIGDVPSQLERAAQNNLQALRAESQLRIAALQQRPPVDLIPSQFVGLSKRNKHAIAVDTAKARLYLFENTGSRTRLLADYYISVGKAGVGKLVEGDLRTPLGVYFITSSLDPKSLPDLYGSGALPVSYPNVLDVRRGKTGSGIWLHGNPSSQFTREPQATEGCVALANPDLDRIIRTVEIRTTPVLIGKNFKWVRPNDLQQERQQLEGNLQSWAAAKSSGRVGELLKYYASDFNANGKDLAAFSKSVPAEIDRLGRKSIQLNDVSLIRWTDEAEILVATFGELTQGARTGRTLRQYWQKRSDTWKIIYEGELV